MPYPKIDKNDPEFLILDELKIILSSTVYSSLSIPEKIRHKNGPAFSLQTKKILARSNIRVWFKVTCHTLRHSFASHLNDEGVDIMVLQSLLGHSTPKSTQIYIHPSMQKVREALEKLPAVIYMNQLVQSGALNLKFQSKARYRPKMIDFVLN